MNKKVRGISSLRKLDIGLCKNCQIGKMGKTSFKSKNYHSKEVLELVHTKLCGPIGIESYSGDKYFILFVDDQSRMITVMYLKDKSIAFQKFKWYMASVEKEIGKKLKCLSSDREREFISNKFNEFYTKKGIKRQVSFPGTPQQNGIVERSNRPIMACARTLMIEENVPIKYWKEGISTTIHTLNRVQLKEDSNQTPYKLQYGYKPNVSYLKVFGFKCYILKESRKGKFNVKSDEGIFLGYSCRNKAYKCLNLTNHKIIQSAHVMIDEFAEKNEEASSKEPEDYKRFVYNELDTFPNLIGSQEASPPESPKSPKAHMLQPVQSESQSEGPKSKAIDLQQDATKSSEGPKSQTVGPNPNLEVHFELCEKSFKSKILVLAR